MRSRYSWTKLSVLILIGLAIGLVSPACSQTTFKPVPITTGDGGWEHVFNVPQAKDIHALFFVDGETGWAVGRDGVILKTTNGGATWGPQRSGTPDNSLNGVWFNDAQNGWAVGSGASDVGRTGVLLRTTDAGVTWQAQKAPKSVSLLSVCFTDSVTGWAVGWDWDKRELVLMKTTDAGVTWSVSSRLNVRIGGAVGDVFFTDADHGCLVMGNDVYRTVDGGKSWVKPTKLPWSYLVSVHFVDRNNGWACGLGGAVLHTSDGGDTWTEQSGGTKNRLCSIQFADGRNGWAAGCNGTIICTNDGGTTWSAQQSNTTEILSAVCFPNRNNGCVAGNWGISARTTDGGGKWVLAQPLHLTNTCARFVDAKTGWITGSVRQYRDSENKVVRVAGAIFKTTDGGFTWTKQRSEKEGGLLSDMCFVDAQQGWGVGHNGLIVSTSDGGATWKQQNSGTKKVLLSARFVDAEHGWVLGADWADRNNQQYSILRTTDGGKTWEELPNATMERMNDMWFISPTTGWVAADKGTLLKTTDGGNTWKRQFVGTASSLWRVQFLSAQLGWLATLDRKILKTTDGGKTWTGQQMETEYPLTLYFIDESTGWASNSQGALRTTDGGITWTRQEPGCRAYYPHFVDRDHGWMTGFSLIRTTTAGLPGCVWAKKQPDGKRAEFGHLVVTKKTADGVYAVHPDSKIGVRIRIKDPTANVGDYIYIHGKIASDGSEKVIDADSVDVITAGWGKLKLTEVAPAK